jgi:hypothetical protein
MMKISGYILILIIPVILASCSSPALHITKKNDLFESGRPRQDRARVVFIRPQTGFAGQGVIAIYDSDKLIGGLSGNSYFIYDADPGEHVFGCYSDPPLMDFLKADIDGGKTYYAQCSFQDRVGMLAAKFIAIKKNSDLMNNLNSILPALAYSVLTDDGISMFTVQNEASGRFIIDRRAPLATYRIDIEGLRENWLKRSIVVQKPQLLTEDGI